jgi:hypothetical protein
MIAQGRTGVESRAVSSKVATNNAATQVDISLNISDVMVRSSRACTGAFKAGCERDAAVHDQERRRRDKGKGSDETRFSHDEGASAWSAPRPMLDAVACGKAR